MEKLKMTRIIQLILIILILIVCGIVIVGIISNNDTLGTNNTLCEYGCGTPVKYSWDNEYHGIYCEKCNKFSESQSEKHTLEEKARKIEGTNTHGWYKKCTICGYEGQNYRTGVCTLNTNGECTYCSENKRNNVKQEIENIKLTSEKYKIDGVNISNIQAKTTINQLKENIQTNAVEVKIYDLNNDEIIEEKYVGTGMKLELKLDNEVVVYTLIVKGDVNGDGLVKINDIALINKARLNKDGSSLEGIYLIAADLTEDGKITLREVDRFNKFRLNLIDEI